MEELIKEGAVHSVQYYAAKDTNTQSDLCKRRDDHHRP
jgi:hypothetical protein